MHRPDYARTIENLKAKPKFIGIQGEPGTGKTHSVVTTMPNITVVAIEQGLEAFFKRPEFKDIPVIPFYDDEFVNEYNGGKFKSPKSDRRPNRRDAIRHFVFNEARLFDPEQTLVWDSWTEWFDSFDLQTFDYDRPKYISKKGEYNKYQPWADKIFYARDCLGKLKSTVCSHIILFHEAKARDKETQKILDKAAPVMSGQFVVYLKKYFPNYWRAEVQDNKKEGKIIPGTQQWLWQVASSSIFNAKCTIQEPEFVDSDKKYIVQDFRKAFKL